MARFGGIPVEDAPRFGGDPITEQQLLEGGALPGVAITDEDIATIRAGGKITPKRRLQGNFDLVNDPELSAFESFIGGGQLGGERVAGGILRTLGLVDPKDLEIAMEFERQRLTDPKRKVSGFLGEVGGESLAFPFGGFGKSILTRLGTAAGTSAVAGGLSKAGEGATESEIALNAMIGGAFGPVGESLGGLLSRSVNNKLSQLFKKKGVDAFFDAKGNPTPDTLAALDELNISLDDFKATFQKGDDISGLDPASAFRRARAQAEGVQLSAGQTTRSFDIAEAEDALKSLRGQQGAEARAFFTEQQQQLIAAKDDFLNKLGADLQEAKFLRGENVRITLKELKQADRAHVNALYKNLSRLPGGQTKINGGSLVELNERLTREFVPSPKIRKGVKNALEDFNIIPSKKPSVTNQGDLTFKNAEKFRQRLNKLSPVEGNDIAFIANMKEHFDNIINDATQQFPDNTAIGLAAIDARKAAANRIRTWKAKDVLEELTSFKKNTTTERVPDDFVLDKILSGDKRGNIKKLKSVLLTNSTEKTRRAMADIRAQAVLDIFNKAVTKTPDGFVISGANLNRAMDNFGDDALRELLTNNQFRRLKNIQAVVADATIPVPRTTNPSGTAAKLINILSRFTGMSDKIMSIVNFAITNAKDAAQINKTLRGIQRGPAVKRAAANLFLTSAIAIPTQRAATLAADEDNQ